MNNGDRTAYSRIAAGFFLVLTFGRLRFSDAQSITSMELEIPLGAKHGYLECAAERCKTATTLEKRTRLLPVVIPTRSFTSDHPSLLGWKTVGGSPVRHLTCCGRLMTNWQHFAPVGLDDRVTPNGCKEPPLTDEDLQPRIDDMLEVWYWMVHLGITCCRSQLANHSGCIYGTHWRGSCQTEPGAWGAIGGQQTTEAIISMARWCCFQSSPWWYVLILGRVHQTIPRSSRTS